MSFHVPEEYRVVGYPSYGNNGAFRVRLLHSVVLIIASDGEGWEHVSVSHQDRIPSWSEMCEVKDIFWDSEDCVVQYHPPKSKYVNCHPFCLHLWRSTTFEFPVPDPKLVGV